MKPIAILASALALATPAAGQVTTVRVEIDYMVDTLHSHRPSQVEMNAVIQMFACKGITLIIDIDDPIPHDFIMSCTTPGVDSFFSCTNDPDSFANVRSTYRDQGAGWHYAIFGHWYDNGDGTDSTGLGELPGNDFFVADGHIDNLPQTPFWRAATFAHELGHNLGLKHYGPNSSLGSQGPFAPNLPSVMNYRYTLNGVASQMECQGLLGNDHLFKDLDFSSGRMPGLNELSMRETRGSGIRSVDWDCDGTIETSPVSKALSHESDWCPEPVGNGFLGDYDEWSSLVDISAVASVASNQLDLDYVTCATMAEMLGGPGACTTSYPTLSFEACVDAQMSFVQGNTIFPGSGTGGFPYKHLDAAVQGSPDGSVLYLQAGTIGTTTGQPLVIDRALVLAGPGGAIVDP